MKINPLLQELLQEFHSIIDQCLKRKMRFNIDMLDPTPVLSDRFIYPNFNEGFLKK